MKTRSIFVLLLLCPVALAQLGAFNGQCSKGGQAVVTQGLPSVGTVPLTGGTVSPKTGAIGSFPSCTVSVFLTGTGTPASPIYSDSLGTIPLTNPFTANTDGSFLFFASGLAAYDITTSGGGMPSVVTVTDFFPSYNLLASNNTFTGSNTFINGIGLGNSLTLASTGTQTGYGNFSSGITTQSSIEVTNGSFVFLSNDTYIKWLDNNFYVAEQAGPRTPAPSLSNNVTLTKPDLTMNSGVATAGYLLGIRGVDDATASGNCMFYSAPYGVMLDSTFGCNTHISFPVRSRRIQWTDGSFNLQLTSGALTASQQVAMPNASGIVNVSLNNSISQTASRRNVSGCATGGTAGNPCASAITVTWTGTFSSTSYAAGCSPVGAPTNFPSAPYVVTKSVGSMTVNYIALTSAVASWPALDCWATQD